MPKVKSRSSVSKRFSQSGNGKIRYRQQGMRHLLTKKRSSRKRRLRGASILSPADSGRIRALMGGK